MKRMALFFTMLLMVGLLACSNDSPTLPSPFTGGTPDTSLSQDQDQGGPEVKVEEPGVVNRVTVTRISKTKVSVMVEGAPRNVVVASYRDPNRSLATQTLVHEYLVRFSGSREFTFVLPECGNWQTDVYVDRQNAPQPPVNNNQLVYGRIGNAGMCDTECVPEFDESQEVSEGEWGECEVIEGEWGEGVRTREIVTTLFETNSCNGDVAQVGQEVELQREECYVEPPPCDQRIALPLEGNYPKQSGGPDAECSYFGDFVSVEKEEHWPWDLLDGDFYLCKAGTTVDLRYDKFGRYSYRCPNGKSISHITVCERACDLD